MKNLTLQQAIEIAKIGFEYGIEEEVKEMEKYGINTCDYFNYIAENMEEDNEQCELEIQAIDFLEEKNNIKEIMKKAYDYCSKLY